MKVRTKPVVVADAALFLCFCCLLGTAMLMEYLPSSLEPVHAGLALALLLILIVQVRMRWRSLSDVMRGRSREGPGTAIGLVIVLIGLVALAVLPLL